MWSLGCRCRQLEVEVELSLDSFGLKQDFDGRADSK